LAYAEDAGWRVVKAKGHAWGKIQCPYNDQECRCGLYCQASVWSTPRVPEDIAAKICRAVDGCARRMGEESSESGSQPKERGGGDG
jgi:hypothetical protein